MWGRRRKKKKKEFIFYKSGVKEKQVLQRTETSKLQNIQPSEIVKVLQVNW